MEAGDVIGHEPMGEVVEVGSEIDKFKKGDRVVVPFTISCGRCFFCERQLHSLCDESNPNADQAATMIGHSPCGLLGYSRLFGGYSGGQAELLRVPFADVGPIKVPDGLEDNQALFLSDIFPTGYMAAENAQIEPGDTVAVWGCGPVAQFAIQSAWMLGAGRVIAIDQHAERLEMARASGKAETINFAQSDVYETLQEMTGGRGPDRCIDAAGAGAETHATVVANQAKSPGGESARASRRQRSKSTGPLAQAIKCCRKGGTISVLAVYTGNLRSFPISAAMLKGLTLKTAQTHVPKYMPLLLERIESGQIDPSFVITHEGSLDEGPELYQTFSQRTDHCVKVVLKP